MAKFLLPLSLVSIFFLFACETSSLTEAEKAPVPAEAPAFAAGPKRIDRAQSRISFVGKSTIVDHEGKFNEYEAVVTLDDADPSNLERAQITVTVAIASVETDSKGLDDHVQRDDFFAAEQYPTATFTSTSIVHQSGTTHTVMGDLTIRDMTKQITFDAEITDAYLTAVFDLPRQEFGIGNDSYGDKLLDPVVPVDVKIVFAQ